MIEICRGSEDSLPAIRELFEEYARWLQIDLSYQNFDAELNGLPGMYEPPGGRLLLARVEGVPVGCVAMRPLGSGICEMKRLYVRPGQRGRGTGTRLVNYLIDEAVNEGYRLMRLDTLTTMPAAQALYRQCGFTEISAYYESPVPGTVYLELDLKTIRKGDG